MSRKKVYKRLRKQFNEKVFERDNRECKICGETGKLDAHHITDRHLMPFGGYVLENGISLCPEHHLEAEKFHMTDGEDWIDGMHPDDLYEMIGSSKELALEESNQLEEEFDKRGIITLDVVDKYQYQVEKQFDQIFDQVKEKLKRDAILEINQKNYQEMVQYILDNLYGTVDIYASGGSYMNENEYQIIVDLHFNDPNGKVSQSKNSFIDETFTVTSQVNKK